MDYIAFDYLKVDGEVVPEPGTLALFGTGMVIVWGAARRRLRGESRKQTRGGSRT
jgi:hypothetical protein